MRKIGIIGSAGTGRSTIGLKVSQRLDLPFLASSQITRSILDRDGYNYTNGQVEKFLAQEERQDEILRKLIDWQTSTEDFVTDRTVIDLAAYALEEDCSDITKINRFITACRRYSGTYTHLFLCPWIEKPLKDNRRRTLNPWYQFKIQSLQISLLREFGIDFHVLKTIETEDRIEEILSLLS